MGQKLITTITLFIFLIIIIATLSALTAHSNGSQEVSKNLVLLFLQPGLVSAAPNLDLL